jgi:hypothetical protein
VNGKDWQRGLMADVMATTLANVKPARVLVRSVGDSIRGVLSERYRRLNSAVLAESGRAAIQAVGAVPVRATIDDLKWSIEAVNPNPVVLELGPHGQEMVALGVRFGNSDFGAGAEHVSAFMLRLRCLNGLIAESILRTIHLGGRINPDVLLSERTYRLDTQTQASAINDVIRGICSKSGIEDRIAKLRASAEEIIDPAVAVGGLVKAKRITKGEGDNVMAVIARNNPDEVPVGPATRYKLAQAFAFLGHADGVNADRGTEYEALAGLMTFNAEKFVLN